MRGEFDALRKVAHLASDVLELETRHLRGGDRAAKLDELREALGDLRARFPYTLATPEEAALAVALREPAEPVGAQPTAAR